MVREVLVAPHGNIMIPLKFSGLKYLSFGHWVKLVGLGAIVGYVGYSTFTTTVRLMRRCKWIREHCPQCCKCCLDDGCNEVNCKVNWTIEKDKSKVKTEVPLGEVKERVSYCRCWRSKKFPYCDGAHGEHNKQTGDNVGPVTLLPQ